MKLSALLVVVTGALCLAQQMADPDFDTTVAHPAYTDHHPRVAIDGIAGAAPAAGTGVPLAAQTSMLGQLKQRLPLDQHYTTEFVPVKI